MLRGSLRVSFAGSTLAKFDPAKKSAKLDILEGKSSLESPGKPKKTMKVEVVFTIMNRHTWRQNVFNYER